MSAYIFLTSDSPLEEVWQPSGQDGNFFVLHNPPILELSTDKSYFAALEIHEDGCEAEIVQYLKTQLETVSEIEVWHVWLDMDFGHKVWKVEISSDSLTPEDIQELLKQEVYQEPVIDYCYQIVQTRR